MFLDKKGSISADERQLTDAAGILHVSEFRLFEMAYADWFGHNAQQPDIESAYIAYMLYGHLPCWCRHYVRHTLNLCGDAGLYLPRQHTRLPSSVSVDFRYVILAASLVTLLIVQLTL